MTCPVCGCQKLFGPAVVQCEGETWEYVDCARCHTLCLVVDGELEAKASAW